MTRPLLTFGDLVELAPSGTDLFTTVRCPGSRQRLHGSGLLVAAVLAAAATIDAELVPASMHTTFLRAGRPAEPVELAVDRLHDGRTSRTRGVVMRQGGVAIATSTIRLVDPHDDQGWHRSCTPEVDAEAGVPELAALADLSLLDGFDVRAAALPADGRRIIHPCWIRHQSVLPDDALLHVCVVAFVTDLGVSGSARPPGTPLRDRLGPVTLDHSLWFHRPARADDWLLITADSLSEAGSRAVARGEVSTASGSLVASFTQQAMVVPARGHP